MWLLGIDMTIWFRSENDFDKALDSISRTLIHKNWITDYVCAYYGDRIIWVLSWWPNGIKIPKANKFDISINHLYVVQEFWFDQISKKSYWIWSLLIKELLTQEKGKSIIIQPYEHAIGFYEKNWFTYITEFDHDLFPKPLYYYWCEDPSKIDQILSNKTFLGEVISHPS